MDVRSLGDQAAFTTADGSTIREILHPRSAPVCNQSLAEASLAPGQATRRHYHAVSEELYLVLEGRGEMELDGELRAVGPGDAIPIAPGARHTIRASGEEPLRFLCCCAPPYRDEDTHFD